MVCHILPHRSTISNTINYLSETKTLVQATLKSNKLLCRKLSYSNLKIRNATLLIEIKNCIDSISIEINIVMNDFSKH